MCGEITLSTRIIRNGVALHGHLNMPLFMPGPVEPRYTKLLNFEGISVDEQGKQHYIDATIAFRQAALNAIAYLTKFGYTAEQAYLLLSAAPCEARIAAIVDIPNACVAFGVPTEIFEFDVDPKHGGPVRKNLGSCPLSRPKSGEYKLSNWRIANDLKFPAIL